MQKPSKLTWNEMQELGRIIKQIKKLDSKLLPYLNKIQLYRYEKLYLQYRKTSALLQSRLDTIVCTDFPNKSNKDCINTFYG